MNIAHYLPINTKEKVDQLIVAIEASDWPTDMAKLELSVRLEIRKAKIQFYFQEEFVKMRLRNPTNKTAVVSSRTVKPSNIQAFPPSVKATKEEHALCKQFIGLNIAQVSYQMDKDTDSLVRTLNGLGGSVTPDSIFTETIYNQSKEFITNYLYIKKRSAKLKSMEDEQLAQGFAKKNEKFKTSYGKEGNYSKLIYAQPKS